MKVSFREKFKLTKQDSNTKPLTCTQRLKKWDRRIASMFGLLAFFTLIGIVIYNTLRPNDKCCGGPCENKTKLLEGREVKCRRTKKASCEIQCANIKEDQDGLVAEHLMVALQEEQCPVINLIITATHCKQDELSEGWLKGVDAKVELLSMADCSCKINERALMEQQLSNNLRTLTIINPQIPTLNKDSFRGATYLNDLIIENRQGVQRLVTEEQFLQHIKLIRSISIRRFELSAQDVTNLFGKTGVYMNKLVTIDLRNNVIPTLGEESFLNAPILAALHLEEVGLTRVHQNAFREATTITLLNLRTNALETLQEDTFGSIKFKSGQLQLSGNRWNCNCSLLWLQEYYNTYNYVDKENPPVCFKTGSKFDETDFCPPTTTPPSEQTETTLSSSPSPSATPPSTTQAPPPNYEYVKIVCKNQTLSPMPNYEDQPVESIHTVQVTIRDNSVILTLYELDQQPLVVVVKTHDDLRNYHLMWFNADNKTEDGCITPIKNVTILENLSRGTTYTFSLLRNGETTLSPKSSFCIKTEPDWALRTWIPNKYQAAAISISICVLILSIGLTTLITIVCIRRHPKIIANNKDVIIVKSKKIAEAPDTPPREYEGPAYWEPYLVASSQGYLTPKFNRYSKVRYRPPLIRSISEWSFSSANNQYADPRQIQALRMLQQVRRDVDGITGDSPMGYDEFPPPLPPPNPGSRRNEIVRQVPQEDVYEPV